MIISEIFMIKVNCVDDAIEFLDDNYCFYDLTFSEIFRDGIEFWLNHLSYKNWFSDDVKSNFLAIINEHARI